MDSRRPDGGRRAPLLKTCQTCFRAKIRCDRTQASGACDRCLRLDKTCIFPRSRRRHEPRRGPPAVPRDAGEAPGELEACGAASVLDQGVSRAVEDPEGLTTLETPRSDELDQDMPCDPFKRGLLSLEDASSLLDIFRATLVPHFPFVVVSPSTPLEQLHQHRPALCLAILAAASFGNLSLQRSLGALFNELVGERMAKRMANDRFATLDMLQALLVHVSWAHYQPRPRRYSQHLLLAVSIVTDLRLDRPKNPLFWSVDVKRDESDPGWSPDWTRAVAGTYYLASSSSFLLQKPRHFRFAPYILEACKTLARESDVATDWYLPLIIEAQRIIESIDELVAGSLPPGAFEYSLATLSDEYRRLKGEVSLSLSRSPSVFLQLNMIKLLLLQKSPSDTPFGLDEMSNSEGVYNGVLRLEWLSERVFAVSPLVNIIITLPPGGEVGMSNIEWITVYCAFSLAARLDVLAAHPSMRQSTQQIRGMLDMPHALRQVVLRLESASGLDVDATGDRDAFFQLAQKARRLEEWYLAQMKSCDSGSTSPGTSGIGIPDFSPTGTTPRSKNWEHQSRTRARTNRQEAPPISELFAEYGSDLGLGNFSYTEPFDFLEMNAG